MMRINSIRLAVSARTALLAGAAALVVPGAALAQTAEPQPEEYSDGNEIIVTATKREQTLQDVPVAVSVTTADVIERAFIRDIRDLGTVVPSLRVGERQNSANTNFFIRGFGNGANNAGIEPSVGVFIDGVYRSRSAAQIADLPDVSRVEVLRGPQSTLFGKNASAGVISIVTQRPQFEFGGNVEASYGNYDAKLIKGVVTGPISDTIAVSLAGGWNKRDGYNRDLGTSGRTNDRNRWFLRGQVLFQPSEDLSIRLIGDYGKINETCCAVVNLRTSPATQVLVSPLIGGRVNTPDQRFDNIVYSNFDSSNRIKNYGISGQIDYEIGAATLTSITAWRRSTTRANFDTDFTSADLLRGANIGYADLKTFTQELRLAAELGDRVNLLVGGFYFHEKVRQATDLDWGADARTFADQLVRGASGGALNIPLLEGTFGALEGAPGRYVGQFFAPGQGITEYYEMTNKNYSLFSQVDFEVTDRLTLTGGINYTNDKKRFSSDTQSSDVFSSINFNAPAYAPLRNQLLFQGGVAQTVGAQLGLGRNATQAEIGAFAAGNPAAFGAIAAGAQAFANANQNNPLANPLNGLRALQYFPPFVNFTNNRTSDDKFTYTLRAAYDVTDTVNAYVSYATGYKASSVNLSRDSRPGARTAAPENSTVYEAGLKGNWSVASANLAVFHQSIKGFQSNIFTGTGFVLANAGKQSVFGIEFEGTVRPVKGLTLGLSMTYLDPKYNSFVNSAFGDVSGMTPADIPPISATFSAQYEHEMGNGDRAILRGSYHYESEVQVVEGLPGFIARNPATGAALPGGFEAGLAAARPYTRQVDEIDASFTYAMANGLELSVWGRNLLNDRYISTIFDSPAQSGSISGYTNQPRTYGVAARFRW